MARRRGRIFRAFERMVLGIGLSMVAFVVEKRLLKAIKKGDVDAAPRTAAARGEQLGDIPPPPARHGELAPPSHQVHH
jgi:hypothetical protein